MTEKIICNNAHKCQLQCGHKKWHKRTKMGTTKWTCVVEPCYKNSIKCVTKEKIIKLVSKDIFDRYYK